MKEQKKESLINLIKLIVHSPLVREQEKKKVLRKVIAWYTEVDGKFNTKYRTEGVYKLLGSKRNGTKLPKDIPIKIQLEHVIPISNTISEMLANPENVTDILNKNSTTCLVTKEEHDCLDKVEAISWNRYESCEIRVVNLDELIK